MSSKDNTTAVAGAADGVLVIIRLDDVDNPLTVNPLIPVCPAIVALLATIPAGATQGSVNKGELVQY